MQGILWSNCTEHACCQSHFFKKTQMDTEAICKKWKRIVITKPIKKYKQAASCFHCSASRTSDDMFDVDNIEDLEEVSKTLTNMCQEDIDVLNIKGCHPKSCIMHCFPITPTCARPFLANKDESFDNDLACQLFWDNKGQQCGEKIYLLGYETQCKGPSTPCFLHQHLLRQRKKKSRHSASDHASCL